MGNSERQWRTIVPVRCPHNTRDENKAIKAGDLPEGWADKPAKRSQKDVDARWSEEDHLLMKGNTGAGVWAGRQSCANDSSNIGDAYRSEEMEAKLRDRKLKSHIHRKGKRGKPLTEQAKSSNRTKPSVRVRVEHVFGAQLGDMGGTLVRTSGLVRAKARIGIKNLACNEEGKELIRGITSPTNATPPPVA